MECRIETFLRPLDLDVVKAHQLSYELYRSFQQLSADSLSQFLPTPISESILRPAGGREKGRYLAIDIGGTNLRVGFVELLGTPDEVSASGAESNEEDGSHPPNLRRILERSWPISEHLKNENADSLFAWIGHCIATVVRDGCEQLDLPRDAELPMGVTFSFPIVQNTLSEATIMAMGKGFAITSNLDLGTHLVNGYSHSKEADLPPIKVTAILNDAVATLVSFIYQSRENEYQKAAMGLICGTGCNATIPLWKSTLHAEKLPEKVKVPAGQATGGVKVAVNTEWSINGTLPALQKVGLVSGWDVQLDSEGEVPGFQPLEYMTAGRYLGELARLMFLDYLKNHLGVAEDSVPEQLRRRFGLTTTFLSHFRPLDPAALLRKLQDEFPAAVAAEESFAWTEVSAASLYHIAKAIEVRAAGMIAASIVGLLACAGDIPLRDPLGSAREERFATNGVTTRPMNLIVGYTGGCIVHFQDYLADCQKFLDGIIEAEFGAHAPVRVTLSPCHDGGLTGAGVLCGASQVQSKDV